jgi:hypothetical protein
MKSFNFVLGMVFLFSISGCKPAPLQLSSTKPTNQTTPQEPVPQSAEKGSSYTNSLVTAPVDYIAASIQAGEKSKAVIDIAALNKAIELYEATEGQKPPTLDDLVQKKYIAAIPPPPVGKKINYDSTTGKVTIVSENQ